MRIARSIACLALFVSAPSAPAAERLVWFGTFTRGPAGSEGIYVSRFDDASGTLAPPVLAARAKNPGFLAMHPSLPLLYAVSEVADHDGKPAGGILSFTIDDRTGTLTKQTGQPSGGAGPCHVSVDRTGKAVLAANYGGGSVICLGLDADGGLRPVATGSPGGFIQHEGKSVNEKRQETAHAHSIYPAADGRFAITCDLGIDKVLVHALDVGEATLAPHAFAPVKPGAGPRHFAFHPTGRFGYACNELDLTVTGFAFDPAAGTLAEFQTLSTLPPDVADRTGFSTAEIVAHPNGKFLYVSNRGHHSIAMFAVDEQTGKLTFLGVEAIRGQTPRNFALDPTGKFLLAAGMDSNTVTVFAIDRATGRLTFTGTSIDVPMPVCIRFRPLDATP
jgi:6-phosphogluconolactonase